jgi:translation elongation factor EF-Tu-like GTPase
MSDDYADDQLLHEGVDDEAGGNGAGADGAEDVDPELEAIKARVRQMEEEALKLKQMQNEVDQQMTSPGGTPANTPILSVEEKMEVDGRYVIVRGGEEEGKKERNNQI